MIKSNHDQNILRMTDQLVSNGRNLQSRFMTDGNLEGESPSYIEQKQPDWREDRHCSQKTRMYHGHHDQSTFPKEKLQATTAKGSPRHHIEI